MPFTIDLDATTRRTIHRALKEAFPDAHVLAADVDAAALALYRRANEPRIGGLPAELAQLDLSPYAEQLEALAQLSHADSPDGLTAVPRGAEDTTRYYWIEARHARVHPSGYVPFVGQFAMARVSLPASQPETVRTALGSFEPEDHLIATVDEANRKFTSNLGYELQRVDMVTPMRQGLRFGAISVMLGYRDAAAMPSCYILEAGTATGQPKVLFLGEKLDTTIDRYSGYKPTPFSCPDNAYTGRLLVEGDNPKQLHIKARKILNHVSQPHYIDVMVSFTEQTETLRNIWSGVVLAEAALIVWLQQQRGLPDGCQKQELPA